MINNYRVFQVPVPVLPIPDPKIQFEFFFKILLEKKQEEVEKPFHLAVSDG
jgi:hypothetical protein